MKIQSKPLLTIKTKAKSMLEIKKNSRTPKVKEVQIFLTTRPWEAEGISRRNWERRLPNQTLMTRQIFVERFPLCFAGKGKPKRPLKIKIHLDILKRCDDKSQFHLNQALKDYCTGVSYLECLVEGADRVDLDGNVVGKVTEKQHQLAKMTLDKRHRREKNDDRTNETNLETVPKTNKGYVD